MATGVLIVGLGKGTKSLQSFLGCTKTYEATVLFGAATDSYDTLGKVLSKAPYEHVTEGKVEEALAQFRGKIMQKPPLYSALHVQGKRLYEYAREGKEVPVEIQSRPVEVEDIRIVEWLPGGSHTYRWPEEDAEKEDKAVAEKVLHLNEPLKVDTAEHSADATPDANPTKRKRSIDDAISTTADAPATKRQEVDNEPLMSGALLEAEDAEVPKDLKSSSKNTPPAVKLRMTVTSGFYVRSLAHDLGKAVNSLGCMSDLVRTRQENFELGRNVLEMTDIEKGEEAWAPRLQAVLVDWQGRENGSNQPSVHESPSEEIEPSLKGEASPI